MTVQAVLYDNDGTLVDTHDLILGSMRHTVKAVLGRDYPDEVLMNGVGTPLENQMLVIAEGDRDLCHELQRVYREHNHAVHDDMVSLFPGVAEGMRALSEAGIAQGVVTAKRHALAQRGLEIVGVWDRLDCLVGADDCPRSKPEPDPIVMGCELLGLAPEECIYLGDSPFDMQAGIAAGCLTVAALWGMFPADVLAAHDPAHASPSFAEFVDYVLH